MCPRRLRKKLRSRWHGSRPKKLNRVDSGLEKGLAHRVHRGRNVETQSGDAHVSRPKPGYAWDAFVRWLIVGALVAIAFLTVAGTLTAPLAEPDEARYAEVAREMVSSGDWIVPRVNGDVFLDKPPLVFWAEAAALKVLGVHDWAARLPVLIAALLCLVVTFLLARELVGSVAAWLAVLLLATAPLFFGMGQVLTLDVPLTLWTTASMAAIWFGYSRTSKAWYRLAYVCCALGVLTKGPVAVLLVALPALLFLLDRGREGDFRRAFDPFGVTLFLLVSLPWFIAMESREPGFLFQFVAHHHFERFVNPWQHREPFWFFIPVLLVGFFPWSLLWLCERRGTRHLLEGALRRPQALFIAVYALVPLLFFSASSSKLIPYILPAFPPLAIFSADLYTALFRNHGRRLCARSGAFFAVTGVALLAVGMAFFFVAPHWRAPLLRPYLMTGGFALSLLGGLTCYTGARGHERVSFALLMGVLASILALLVSGRDLAKNYRDLARGGGGFLAADTQLFSYRHDLPAIEFYLRRHVRVVGRGEEASLAARWRRSRSLAVFTRSSQVEKLAPYLPDSQVVASGFDTVLLVHRPTLAGRATGRVPSVARD